MRIGIFILLSLLLYSCSKTSETEQYAKLVEQWQGKEIKFPDVMTDLLTGDTIDLSDADFTILTYIDSTGCTECRMKLPIWKTFIETLDSITDLDVNVILAINSKDKKRIAHIINNNQYEYPVIYDQTDEVVRLNSFPEDDIFKTFLLNKSHHIIAIGNPIINEQIAKLYKDIVSGEKSFNSSGSSYVYVDSPRIDIGMVHLGDNINHKFIVHNKGIDTIYVQKAISSCSCTNVSLGARTIAPNEDLPIGISFAEDSIPGEFDKSVYIYYRNLESPTILSLRGIVIK
ncbi:MAG: DUF1573 domain-containing protein [Duncaniella sp.]|nr:DUF1573 domain-containing protein [Duncaniella sp.]